MKTKKWIGIITGIISLVLFIALIVCLKKVDVAPHEVGSIGLHTLNVEVREEIGTNMDYYKMSDILGYLSFLTVLFFVILGAYQLVKRKSLKKIDKEIWCVAILYICMGIVYVLFDKVIVLNYRPIMLDGVFEPSFPSTHTFLSICLLGSMMVMNNLYFDKLFKKNAVRRLILNMILIVMMFGIIYLRLFSGVHWFTDILGGILLGTAFVAFFKSAISCCKK